MTTAETPPALAWVRVGRDIWRSAAFAARFDVIETAGGYFLAIDAEGGVYRTADFEDAKLWCARRRREGGQ